MKALLNRIKSWHAQSKLRRLRWWEKTRAKGKTRFVLEGALTYGLMVIGMTDVFENLFGDGHFLSLGKVIYYLLVGIPLGMVGWSSNENDYQKALNEARANALPASQTTPPNTLGP